MDFACHSVCEDTNFPTPRHGQSPHLTSNLHVKTQVSLLPVTNGPIWLWSCPKCPWDPSYEQPNQKQNTLRCVVRCRKEAFGMSWHFENLCNINYVPNSCHRPSMSPLLTWDSAGCLPVTEYFEVEFSIKIYLVSNKCWYILYIGQPDWSNHNYLEI
jgi:hypothetical protein